MRRIVHVLLFAVLVAVLHLAPPASPALAVETTEICELNAAGSECAPTYPAPELLNPGALAAATTEQAAALRRLSELAIDNTLADHQLPKSDRAAVLSWGRSQAQAELFALIVAGIKAPETERTADEQDAVDWMGELIRRQAQVHAEKVGEEYARWAGLNVHQYQTLLGQNASAADLTSFLSGPVAPYDNPDTANATGGYCKYRSPSPYSTEYTGYQAPTCFAPCTNPLGCNPPTPSYDEFVKWGTAAGADKRLGTAEFVFSAADIATASTFGASVVAAAVIGAVVGATGSSAVMATIASSMFIYTAYDVSLGVAAGAATASGGGVAAAAIGGTVAVVILAIVIAVLQGIKVGDAAALPGKIAGLVVNSRTQAQDVPAVLDTSAGATSIFAMFVGSTLPLPQLDPPHLPSAPSETRCDNSLIPPTAYTNGLGSTILYLPLGDGGGIQEVQLSTIPCLNPPRVPPAEVTDPHFKVRNLRTGTVTESPTITVLDEASGITVTSRVHGNWFISRLSGSSSEYQSLRLHFTAPNGDQHRAWLVKEANGRHRFLGYKVDETTVLDADTCEELGLCWDRGDIAYVGADGEDYVATLEPYTPPQGTPGVTRGTGEPVEASPVSLRANGFAPADPTGAVTYSWRFQKDICGYPCASSTSLQTPSYGDPVAGDPVTHTWQTSGTYLVQVTATDQSGKQAVTAFPVRVASVPPVLKVESVEATGKPGVPVTLRGTVDHVGQLDTERVTVNWGDGSAQDTVIAGPGVVNVIGQRLKLEPSGSTRFNLTAPHTYPAGIYYGTVKVVDQSGATDVELFRYTVADDQPQVIDFPAIADQTYGTTLTMAATGGGSGNPVTYIAGPASVCTASGTNNATIKLVGAGDCQVGANQAGSGVFLEATEVVRTFHVNPAPLNITADDKSKVYRADDPVFTAFYDGLVNGDTKAAITGLTITGAPSNSDVGQYPIVPSGATSPNYVITYTNGTETVAHAALTITADDKTKVYGAEDPVFTVKYAGFVGDDTQADVTGLEIHTAPTGAGAGKHPIVPSGATSSNYAITYVNGTETITPAPLTVTADDQTKVYGADDPAFTASSEGLVNGDARADLTGLKVSGAPKASDVGSYPVIASGITNPNYDVTYVHGTEKITPATLKITADDRTKVYGADDPVFTASYDGLVNGDTKTDITGLTITGAPSNSGVGQYPIVPSGATNPNYDISLVAGTEKITPAPLTITADDQTKVYGADDPAFTASYDGLVNGDTKTDITGLVVTGAPSNVNVGLYLIQPSGATNANYDITLVDGLERVIQAPLKITADDKTKVYGAPDPTFTTKVTGLVNGDIDTAITGLKVTGAPTGSNAGTYPIVPSGATNPNYDIAFANGTETIDPAPLTIKADDKTAKYGTVATYTWTGTGWVNGDGDGTIDTAPTCKATAQGAAASVTTAPGAYLGAITCSGAADSNYTVGYASGKLTVNPVIRLSQTGLPATVLQRATIDGQGVTLPTSDVEVGYGTAHTFSFPAAVVDSNGVAHMTTTAAFSGPVSANITVSASYTTMTTVLASAVATGGTDQTTAKNLTSLWNEVQAGLKAANVSRTIGALRNFAEQVRSQSGKKIKKPTADALLAHAQSVYTTIGGTGKL